MQKVICGSMVEVCAEEGVFLKQVFFILFFFVAAFIIIGYQKKGGEEINILLKEK